MFCRTHLLWSFALILLLAGTLQAAVHHVERPDSMQGYFLMDVDRRGDRVRVLYHSLPSLEQQTRDDWTVNVYVAELHADGTVKQQRLVSDQRRYAALLLRRGHDEAILIPAPGPPGSGSTQPLEIRSTRDGTVLSSTEVDVLPRIELGTGNIGPTADGNIVVIDFGSRNSRGRTTGIVLRKISTRGELLGSREYENAGAQVGWGGVFPARGDAVALTVTATITKDAPLLKTDIDNPVPWTFDGRTVEAQVFSETRLLVADTSGGRRMLSTALERTFMWGSGFTPPEDLPAEKRLQWPYEIVRIQEEIGLEYGMRDLLHTPDAAKDTDHFRPTGSGYATLARKTVARDRVPPAAGPYFLEVGLDGAIRREIYLGPLVEEIGANQFIDFLPTSDGGFLLVGHYTPKGERRQQVHVTRVDAQGTPNSMLSLGMRRWQLEGIAGTESNVWLLGHQWNDEHKQVLLVAAQVDMSVAQPLTIAERAAPPDAPPPTAKPVHTSAVPSYETPPMDPGGDCSCTCEEYAKLKKWLESFEKMSDADKMKVATDPGYLKRMECAGKCAVAFGQCAG